MSVGEFAKIRYLAIFGLIGGIFFYFSPLSVFIFLSAFFSLRFVTRRMERLEKHFIIKFFVIGFALRVVFAAASTFIAWYWNLGYRNDSMGYFMPDLMPDSGAYSLRGLLTAEYLRGALDNAKAIDPRWLFMVEKPDYGFIIYTIFYYFFGFAQIAVRFFNCLLGVFSALVVYLIAKEAFDKHIAKNAYMLALFFPTLFLWSTTNLKETPTFFLIALLILVSIKFRQKPRISYMLYGLLLIFLVSQIRNNLLLPVLVSFFVPMAFMKPRLIWRIVVFSLLFAVIMKLSGHDCVSAAKNLFFRQVNSMVEFQRGFVSEGGLTYKIYPEGIYNAPGGAITFLDFIHAFIKGWAYFLFVPFPWDIQSFLELISMPVVLLWYSLFLLSIQGVVFAFRRTYSKASIILFYVILITTPLALISGNIGTVFRHRDLVLPLYLIFAAAGIPRMRGAGGANG